MEEEFDAGITEITSDELRDALHRILNMSNWSFGINSDGFGGYSEGACFLAGIEPRESQYSQQEGYLWDFLFGAARQYGCNVVGGLMQGNITLDDAVIDTLNRAADALPSGVHTPKEAIKTAVKSGVRIPWLRSDKLTPEMRAKLPSNAQRLLRQSPEQVSTARSAAAKSTVAYSQRMVPTKKLAEEIYRDLKKAGWADTLAESSRLPVAKKVTRHVYAELEESLQEPETPFPEKSTVESWVSEWVREYKAQQKS